MLLAHAKIYNSLAADCYLTNNCRHTCTCMYIVYIWSVLVEISVWCFHNIENRWIINKKKLIWLFDWSWDDFLSIAMIQLNHAVGEMSQPQDDRELMTKTVAQVLAAKQMRQKMFSNFMSSTTRKWQKKNRQKSRAWYWLVRSVVTFQY